MKWYGSNQEHRLWPVLFFVAWLNGPAALGQEIPRTLFPRMPRSSSFPPTIIQGVLPERSGLQVSKSRVSLARQPLRRNGKAYWEIDLYYDNEIHEALMLRQQGDTVWLALDAWDQDWDAEQAAQKLPAFQQSIRELHEQHPSDVAPPPASLEENVLLRFNARAGEKWTCFSASRGGVNFYRVELEKIIPRNQGETLYVFALSRSMRASHMPQLMKLVVSKTRGIRGMLWYDYACWEPYECEDLLVRYGDWQ